MCIIIYKPAGVEHPEKAILRICNENNPDYNGFMVATGSEVIIRKGFEGVRSLRKAIRKTEKDSKIDMVKLPVVYHFRIATSGLIKPQNSHPFPLSSKVRDLQSCNISCESGVVHNGVLSGVGSEKHLSDTQLFIRDFLSKFSFLELGEKRIKNLVNLALQGDRFLVLNKSGLVKTWGAWLEVGGLFYSNDGYKQEKWGNYFSPKGYVSGSGKVYSSNETSQFFKKSKCKSCGESFYNDEFWLKPKFVYIIHVCR